MLFVYCSIFFRCINVSDQTFSLLDSKQYFKSVTRQIANLNFERFKATLTQDPSSISAGILTRSGNEKRNS